MKRFCSSLAKCLKAWFYMRPVPFLAVLFILVLIPADILLLPGRSDLLPAEDKQIRVEGRIISRETSAKGCRILLGDIHFPEKNGESGTYRGLRKDLEQHFPHRGRITVYLDGPEKDPDGVSGPDSEEGSESRSEQGSVDQTDIYEQCRIGRRALFDGKCGLPAPATNPGQFDAEAYNRSRDIYMTLAEVSLKSICEEKESAPLRRISSLYLNALSDLRLLLKQAARKVFGERYCSLIDAIVLGDRSGLDPRTRQLFQDGGIMHILAVSSLHVTLLGMAMYKLLRRLRRSFLFSSVWSALIVVSYCLMTGNSYSAVRATVMFLFWLGAQISGRTCDRVTSLSAAALLILVRHPYALCDTGFILSFSCILSIELLGPAFEWIFAPKSSLTRSLTGSLALQAGILPLSLWLFYQTTPAGVLLNLIVLPSMSLFMIFGILGCLLGLSLIPAPFLLPAVRFVSGPCGVLLDLFLLLCRIAQRLPGSVLICGRPPLYKMVLYYSFLLFLLLTVRRMENRKRELIAWMGPARLMAGRKTELFTGAGPDRLRVARAAGRQLKKEKKKLQKILPLLWLLISLILMAHRQPHFRYTCLDIGQGSCNLVEQDGFVFLFDAGSSSVTDVYRSRIESTLKYYGISKVDLVFLSHGDMDHVNGIEEYLSGCHPSLTGPSAGGISIGKILIPDLTGHEDELTGLEKIIKAAEGYGIPVGTVKEGTSIRLPLDTAGGTGDAGGAGGAGAGTAGAELMVLSPSQKRMTGSTNEDCIVLLLKRPGLKILFTGDLEKEGEEMFIEAYKDTDLFTDVVSGKTILVAGHHGSKNATTDPFLDLVKPDLILISCGRNNRYGHPSPDMLKRVRARRIPCARTDRTGAWILNLNDGRRTDRAGQKYN